SVSSTAQSHQAAAIALWTTQTQKTATQCQVIRANMFSQTCFHREHVSRQRTEELEWPLQCRRHLSRVVLVRDRMNECTPSRILFLGERQGSSVLRWPRRWRFGVWI